MAVTVYLIDAGRSVPVTLAGRDRPPDLVEHAGRLWVRDADGFAPATYRPAVPPSPVRADP